MRRGKTVATICACGCGTTFHPRTADVARGWGKFVNKTHKARDQERRTGQHHRRDRTIRVGGYDEELFTGPFDSDGNVPE